MKDRVKSTILLAIFCLFYRKKKSQVMHKTGQQIFFSVLIYLKKTLKHITLAQVLRCLLSSK